jgi:hypothetical protein
MFLLYDLSDLDGSSAAFRLKLTKVNHCQLALGPRVLYQTSPKLKRRHEARPPIKTQD